MPGIAFVPMAVEGLGGYAELDDEVAREVLGLGFAALLPPQAEEGALFIAHDDPGIRTAYTIKDRRVSRFAILSTPSSHDYKIII